MGNETFRFDFKLIISSYICIHLLVLRSYECMSREVSRGRLLDVEWLARFCNVADLRAHETVPEYEFQNRDYEQAGQIVRKRCSFKDPS
jgi:hypothetical protein